LRRQPLRLLKGTSASFQQRFPEAETPLTFCEAFEVTRMLGFKYIWIDSLCIVQDSEEDWLTEPSLMNEVYKNAALTIRHSRLRGAAGVCIVLVFYRHFHRSGYCPGSIKLPSLESIFTCANTRVITQPKFRKRIGPARVGVTRKATFTQNPLLRLERVVLGMLRVLCLREVSGRL
jgi:hypothetical protein